MTNPKQRSTKVWALQSHNVVCPDCNGIGSLAQKSSNGDTYVCIDCKATLFLGVGKQEAVILHDEFDIKGRHSTRRMCKARIG